MSLREDLYKAIEVCPLPVRGGAYLYRGRVSGDVCGPLTALAAYLRFIDLDEFIELRSFGNYTPPAFDQAVDDMLAKIGNHYDLTHYELNIFGREYDREWNLSEALNYIEPEKADWNF